MNHNQAIALYFFSVSAVLYLRCPFHALSPVPERFWSVHTTYLNLPFMVLNFSARKTCESAVSLGPRLRCDHCLYVIEMNRPRPLHREVGSELGVARTSRLARHLSAETPLRIAHVKHGVWVGRSLLNLLALQFVDV